MERRAHRGATIILLLLTAASCDKADPAPRSSPAPAVSPEPAAGTILVQAKASVDDQARSFTCSFTFDPMPADAIVNVVVTGKGVKQPPSLMGTQSWSSKGTTASGDAAANEVTIHEYPGELRGRYGCKIEGVTAGPRRAELTGDTSVGLDT